MLDPPWHDMALVGQLGPQAFHSYLPSKSFQVSASSPLSASSQPHKTSDGAEQDSSTSSHSLTHSISYAQMGYLPNAGLCRFSAHFSALFNWESAFQLGLRAYVLFLPSSASRMVGQSDRTPTCKAHVHGSAFNTADYARPCMFRMKDIRRPSLASDVGRFP